MELEKLKEELRNLKDDSNYFKYPQDASPQTINGIISDLIGDDEDEDNYVEVAEDMNGCDMDWSYQFEFEHIGYSAWGSAYSGSFLIKKSK